MDELRISAKKRIVLDVLQQVQRQGITVVKNPELMNVSLRFHARLLHRTAKLRRFLPAVLVSRESIPAKSGDN
jgi:hypothetical protein